MKQAHGKGHEKHKFTQNKSCVRQEFCVLGFEQVGVKCAVRDKTDSNVKRKRIDEAIVITSQLLLR